MRPLTVRDEGKEHKGKLEDFNFYFCLNHENVRGRHHIFPGSRELWHAITTGFYAALFYSLHNDQMLSGYLLPTPLTSTPSSGGKQQKPPHPLSTSFWFLSQRRRKDLSDWWGWRNVCQWIAQPSLGSFRHSTCLQPPLSLPNAGINRDTQSSSIQWLVCLKIQFREEGVESLQSIDLTEFSILEAIIGISHCRLKVSLCTGSHACQLLPCHVWEEPWGVWWIIDNRM